MKVRILSEVKRMFHLHTDAKVSISDRTWLDGYTPPVGIVRSYSLS
jgi:hypothetical protein